GTGASTGSFFFAGHQADVLAGTLTVGAVNGSTAANGCTGNVTFDTGTFDVSTLLMGNTGGATPQISTGNFTLGSSPASTCTLIGNGTGALNIVSGTLKNVTEINGGAALTKAGTATDTLILDGTNAFSGAFTISAGTVQVGTSGGTGTLGSGPVTNNGTLIFN